MTTIYNYTVDKSLGSCQLSMPKGSELLSVGLQGDKLILVGGGTTDKNGNNNIALMRLLAN